MNSESAQTGVNCELCFVIRRDTIARSAMERWPCFRESDEVVAKPFGDGKWWIAYNPKGDWRWHANIIDGVFYLLSIFIPRKMRGRGLGAKLYEICEGIARETGCTEIRQTPSGKTVTGESRLTYLMRRGWIPDGIEVVKKVRG